MTKFAERLKDAMERRGISQIELHNKCEAIEEQYGAHISRQSLSRYLKGIDVPRDNRLSLLAAALETDPLWLRGYEMDKSFTHEELALVSAWRQASVEERENIAFLLRNYGMKLEKKNAKSLKLATG